MKLNPKPATRKGQTMRTMVFGSSGSGKTIFALEAAKAITGDMSRVLLIDTENESAGLYADSFDEFPHQPWEGPHNPSDLANLLAEADKTGEYDVIIVDGMSPFWSGKGGVLEMVEKLAPKGNTMAGWGKVKPHENDLKQQLMSTKAHLICTVRAKPVSSEDPDPSLLAIGMKPDQRSDFLYEFNTAIFLNKDHSFRIVKKRCEALDEAQTFDAKNGLREYVEAELGWLGENVKYVTAADTELIIEEFKSIPSETRKAAKGKFVEKYGDPHKLIEKQFQEAYDFCLELANEYSAAEPFGEVSS